ncbi:hypothetical protein A2258_01880 [Candidatus Uhrbacteria bacterium RIFOXYA2_FULL_41_8]|nr:MAG: hypothetical protein A2258_01880 [Candidatus Uhrbacteria bacterium RIFOXYA2_FULL_41_8]
MLHALRKIIPKQILQIYHFCLAKLAVFVYRNPSSELIVIGVTGTNGKSSTVQMIAQMLESLGEKVGYTTTAGFYIAGHDIENKMKLTMPGRFYLQRMLRDMVKAGCGFAIIETSSQGIEQYRHLGINYDLVTYTNLTPEHIEAHGGFEAYKKAKSKLFSHLMHRAHKIINGKKIEKVSVINADDEHASYFLSFPADRQITYSVHGRECNDHIVIKNIGVNEKGLSVDVCGEIMQVPYIATFQQKNAISALAVCYALGYSLKEIAKALKTLEPIAGRFERVDNGQDFTVIVDYAYEPYALHALLDSVKILQPKRIIGIHGSAGGGRDRARRYKIGQIAADHEDIVIVTNEDPYDEDPRVIIQEVAKGARESGMKDDVDLLLIDDREQAIKKAILMAKKGDVVLITGKGSETVMAVKGGKLIPFDDRRIALEALKNR